MEESSLLDQYDSQESWTRARRGVLVQRVVCAFRNCSVDLIPFEEVRTRLHLTQKYCIGLQAIELAHIRGSVGRYSDFTSAYLPRGSHLRQRWQRVKTVVITKGMPPIEVYQVGDAYFVVDGNHRVSIARQEGMKTIEAYVCKFVTPVGLSAEADLDEVIIKSEYAEFQKKTRLDKLRPGQEIVFTSPGHYRELECLITMFRDALEETRGEVISYEEAMLLWFDMVYSPAVHEIKISGAMERFPDRTEADLFIWMWQHQQRLVNQYPSSPIQISARRLVGATLLAWFAVLGFDFLLHGGFLARLYAEPSPFLLPAEDAFRLIPLGYLSFLVFIILLVWLMVRQKIGGGSRGLVFGLQIGALTWGSFVLGLLSISTASLELMAGWFIGQTLEAGIGGMVIGWGLVSDRPTRLVVYVVLFVIAAVVVTIILQSVGFAPAVKMR